MPDEEQATETTLEQDIQSAIEGAQQTPPSEPAAEQVTPGEPAAPESAEADISDDKLLISAISAYGGDDLAKKYQTDQELVDGLKSLQKRISQRDAEAEYGRWVQQTYGDLSAIQLQQQQQQTQQTQKEAPPSYDQYQLWRSQVQRNPETGALEPIAGADPGVVSKFQNAAAQLERTIWELSFNPESALRPIADNIVQQAQQTASQVSQQSAAEQRTQNEIFQWEEANKAWLFNSGNRNAGFSNYGQQLLDTVQEYGLVNAIKQGLQTPTQALNAAVLILKGKSAAQPQAVTKPKQQAQHQPNIANQLPQKTSYEELVEPKEGEDLEHHLLRLHQATGSFF